MPKAKKTDEVVDETAAEEVVADAEVSAEAPVEPEVAAPAAKKGGKTYTAVVVRPIPHGAELGYRRTFDSKEEAEVWAEKFGAEIE